MAIKDPVCGMQVDVRTPAGKSEYKGRVYYFCSKGCNEEFDRNPEKYVDETESKSDEEPEE